MRIASLTCSNTEIVCALGLGDQLVAIDDHSDHPPTLPEKVKRVGPDLSIDLDALERLQPELVLASLTVPGHEQVVAGLQERGLPHIAPDPRSLSDVLRDVREISVRLGVPERGEAVVGWMERGLQPSPVQQLERIPLLVEWWPQPVFVPGRYSWINEMLELAGAVNPWRNQQAHSIQVTTDQVVEARPQGVVISWCGIEFDKYRPHRVLQREGWESVPAIERSRVFCISEAYLGRPGPRLVEGVRQLRNAVRLLITDD